MVTDQPNLYISLLDRLVDEEPSNTHESVHSRSVTVKQIEASLVRDLEFLLNTRRKITHVPPAYPEVSRSVFTYGIADFTAENPESLSVKRRLRQEIEQTIMRFEPRLKNLSVRLDQSLKDRRSFYFRITGILTVEPLNEAVAFDTYFDAKRGEYVISK